MIVKSVVAQLTVILVEISKNKLIKDKIKSELGSYLDSFRYDIVSFR
jgi:hypothetical protein